MKIGYNKYGIWIAQWDHFFRIKDITHVIKWEVKILKWKSKQRLRGIQILITVVRSQWQKINEILIISSLWWKGIEIFVRIMKRNWFSLKKNYKAKSW